MAREPGSPIEAFAVALIAAAKADADGVTRLVKANVFDEIPADNARPTPPYIYLGPASVTKVESDCANEWNVRQRLFAASTSFGRYGAWEIAQALVDLFDRNDTLLLTAPYRRNEIIRAFQGGDVIEPANPKLVFVDLSTSVLKD